MADSSPLAFERLCLFDLLGQGIQINQNKPRQFVGISGFCLANACDVMQRFIAGHAQAVRPFLQRFGQLSDLCQVINAGKQAGAGFFRCFVFGGKLKRTSIHCNDRFAMVFNAAPECGFRLHKRAGNGFWQMSGDVRRFGFWIKQQAIDFRMLAQASLKAGRLVDVADCQADGQREKAFVAVKKDIPKMTCVCAVLGYAAFAYQGKGNVFSQTVRALPRKGGGHE